MVFTYLVCYSVVNWYVTLADTSSYSTELQLTCISTVKKVSTYVWFCRGHGDFSPILYKEKLHDLHSGHFCACVSWIDLHNVSCEHSDEPEGSINSREFLDELSVSVASRNLFHGMNSHNNLYLVLYSYTWTHFGQINIACTCTLNR